MSFMVTFSNPTLSSPSSHFWRMTDLWILAGAGQTGHICDESDPLLLLCFCLEALGVEVNKIPYICDLRWYLLSLENYFSYACLQKSI